MNVNGGTLFSLLTDFTVFSYKASIHHVTQVNNATLNAPHNRNFVKDVGAENI